MTAGDTAHKQMPIPKWMNDVSIRNSHEHRPRPYHHSYKLRVVLRSVRKLTKSQYNKTIQHWLCVENLPVDEYYDGYIRCVQQLHNIVQCSIKTGQNWNKITLGCKLYKRFVKTSFSYDATMKPVNNDHLYDKIFPLWYIQWCVLMRTEGTNLLLLTISAFWSSSRWPLVT